MKIMKREKTKNAATIINGFYWTRLATSEQLFKQATGF